MKCILASLTCTNTLFFFFKCIYLTEAASPLPGFTGKDWGKKSLDHSLPLHALVIFLLFIDTSVLFITTPASLHVSHSAFYL